MDLRGLGVVSLGLAIPSITAYLGQYVPAQVKDVASRIPGYNSTLGKATVGVLGATAVAFALAQYGPLTATEAFTASSVAVAMTAVAVAQHYYNGPGSGLVDALPATNLGGSYGYIGSYHGEGMQAELVAAPQPQQMFGVKANVF